MTEWFKEHKAISFILGALIVTALAMIIFGDPKQTESSSISGSVNFNGIGPQDGSDNGNIVLLQKQKSETDFVQTNAQVPFQDNASWKWDDAQSGTTYDLRADVYYQGQFIKSSDVISVTAPASGQVLEFNVSLSDLPDFVIKEATTTVSGNVLVSGYIPANSTISVFQKNSFSNGWEEAVSKLPAQAKTAYEWNEALTGQTYELEARLISAEGTVISKSATTSTVAPADAEDLKVDSTAEAPVEARESSVSGTVNLSGPVKQNSTVLMLQRKVGDANYTAFDRLPADNNVSWSFNTAIIGVKYEITAALQVDEQNTATGNVVTVTAPAKDQTISIDTGLNLPAPNSTPRVACGNEDSTGHFNAQITYPKVSNAAKYYAEVGTNSGGDDVNKGVHDAGNGDLTTTVYIKKDTNYFTRYAYSLCSDCNVHDNQNWSGWSPTLGFRCPN